MLIETNSSNNKLCFSNNIGKIKRVKKPINAEKAFTETGPIIHRPQNTDFPRNYLDHNREKEKLLTVQDEKYGFSESKK
jgi:hypothetical protein